MSCACIGAALAGSASCRRQRAVAVPASRDQGRPGRGPATALAAFGWPWGNNGKATPEPAPQPAQPGPAVAAFAGSLIPETLAGLAAEGGRPATPARRRDLPMDGLPSFRDRVAEAGTPPLARGTVTTLQVNLGLFCNQACRHCHTDSSPRRTEAMTASLAATIESLLDSSPGLETLDLTGGAPEFHPQFRTLVAAGAARGLQVVDRCNLTVLTEPGQADLAAFLAEHHVTVVASLPCYGAGAVDAQRGTGVFARSIAGLRALNAVGYGRGDPTLRLNLMYNPGGAALPPEQGGLEAVYKDRLAADWGVAFDRLLCLANMPVGRFADELARSGDSGKYMALLAGSFNGATLPGLMARLSDGAMPQSDATVMD